MRQFRILVVDDEQRILNFLSSKLKASGYEVFTASDGVKALEQVQTQEPDLVILDILMPKKDGFETLKELRTFSPIPTIILSAKETNADKVKGLTLGADDYLAKPFNPDELVARIEAVRRRLTPDGTRKIRDQLSLGDLVIDFKKHLVILRGKETRLTRIEWLLLSELAQNAGKLILYSDLLTRIWGPEYRDDVQILRTWISRLREKIESEPDSPKLIRTIPKTGYMMDVPSA
ncbi:MAG: response regulator transcription factor [Dehalococcoidia bacterium]|nr:response regulator transcription factor [Dehalococcoidia bacterium]